MNSGFGKANDSRRRTLPQRREFRVPRRSRDKSVTKYRGLIDLQGIDAGRRDGESLDLEIGTKMKSLGHVD